MTYKLNPELKNIISPVILKIGDTETEYENGIALTELTFDTYYLVESISARENKVIVKLKPNDKIHKIDWLGEESTGLCNI